MYIDFPVMMINTKQGGSLGDCEYKMDLIDIALGKWGYIHIELFMLPHIALEIYKLGYLYFGLVLGSEDRNGEWNYCIRFLACLEDWITNKTIV